MWAFAVLLILGLVAILYGVSLLIKGEKESIIRGLVIFASLELLNIVLEWDVRVEIIALISLAILGSYKFFQTEN
jgi:hypothetical protein